MQAVGAPQHWIDSPSTVEPLRLRRAPMLATAICFAAGDLLARRWQPPALLVAALILLLGLAAWSLWRAPRIAALPVLAVWVVVGCTCAQIERPIARQDALTQYADGLSRTVRGRVVRVRDLAPESNSATPDGAAPWLLGPGAWEPVTGAPHLSVDLAVSAVEDVTPDVSTMRSIHGGLRLTVNGAAPDLACGDVIEIPLRLRVPETYRDPGAWSYADYLLGQGVGVLGTAKADRLQVVGREERTWSCRLSAAQVWASGRVDALSASTANARLPQWLRLQPDDATMLSAMLFGDRTKLSSQLRLGFERTGTFHLFVVSGLHVVLLVGGLLWLLRRLRVPDGPAVLVTLAAGLAYALFTGFGAPVQRALGMTAAYLLARWLGRETGPLNALGIAAVTILALDPRALFEASFQMTTLVIVGAAGLAAPLGERTFHPRARALRQMEVSALDANVQPRLAQMRVRMRMYGRLCASLLHPRMRGLPVWLLRAGFAVLAATVFGIAVEICMVMPMVTYFHRAPLLALPVNLLLIPLIGLLLGLAIITFCLSLVSAHLALVASVPTALLLHLIRGAVEHVSHFALADIRVPAPSAGTLILACAAIVFVCVAMRLRSRAWTAAAVVVLVLVPLAVLWPEPALVYPGVLEVTALDVGQGDSLLVVSPEGRTMLVDAGGPIGPATFSGRWDIGEEVVAPYLWSRHIRRLDVVLLTHAHSDHMGGMPAVLRDLRPRELWISIEPAQAPAMRALLEEAQTLGITVRRFHAGDVFMWGGLQGTVLSPELGYSNPGTAKNDDSLVVRLAYGRGSALLEGDAEWASEVDMLLNHRVQESTLLKVGHHGSKTSTAPAFLTAVSPHEAVISVGAHNPFGHPRWEVLERLEQAHVPTWRTDREGAETFLITRTGSISEASADEGP
ncbi:MAG TPA: ComEC/Rec2 family competence protein [Acidobacteriaceae bacterium]|nr:ComEC/Rec2 family competence protein [Acidobacteriaceae bacterium]